MSKQYDFDKQVPVIKKRKLSESVAKKHEQYDFVSEMWSALAKKATNIANTTYARNALSGAGYGAVAGSAAGAFSEVMKSDNDPTKKGMFRGALRGATQGAGVGSVLGTGARFIARRDIGKKMISDLHTKAITDRLIARGINPNSNGQKARQVIKDYADSVNRGTKSRFLPHNLIGVDATGKTVTANRNFGSNSFGWKGRYTTDYFKDGTVI
jgi:hypothetical protein